MKNELNLKLNKLLIPMVIKTLHKVLLMKNYMKKLISISIVFISLINISAQYLPGYVITNQNDTLYGMIKEEKEIF